MKKKLYDAPKMEAHKLKVESGFAQSGFDLLYGDPGYAGRSIGDEDYGEF